MGIKNKLEITKKNMIISNVDEQLEKLQVDELFELQQLLVTSLECRSWDVESIMPNDKLAELWPSGWMDNNGIKHAVYRAKGRKKRHSKLTQELRTESRKRRKVGEASKTVGQSAEGVLAKPSAIVKNVHLPFDREVRAASGNDQDLQENRGMYKHQKDRISQVDGKKDHSGRWAGQKVTSDKIKGETGPQLEHTVKTALIDPHRKMKKSSKSLLHSPKRRPTESSLSLHKSKKLEAFVLMPISEKENLLLPGGSLLRYASEELGPL